MNAGEKLGQIYAKIVGALGRLYRTTLLEVSTIVGGTLLYAAVFVFAFVGGIVLLEVLVMHTAGLWVNLPMGLLCIPAMLVTAPIHLVIETFTHGPNYAMVGFISIEGQLLRAFLGHALALASAAILFPFLLIAKITLAILALATDHATTPDIPVTFSDIVHLKVNRCTEYNGALYPQFELQDYYIASQLKGFIDQIGGQHIPGGGHCYGVGDACVDVPDKVRDISGLRSVFNGIDTLFATNLPPPQAFGFVTQVFTYLFGFVFGDYNGMELMNETLFIHRLPRTSTGALGPRPGGSYFAQVFSDIISMALGCL